MEGRAGNVVLTPLDKDDVLAVVGEGVAHLVLLVTFVPKQKTKTERNGNLLFSKLSNADSHS